MALDYPPVSQRTYDRVTHLLGLDRTEVANWCRDCGEPMTYEFDTERAEVRQRLGCRDCDLWEAL